jgi:cytochrome c-type biogenesis protein CcmE
MTPKRWRRLWLVVGIVAGVGLAAALALRAFRDNVTFYFVPSQVAAGEVHGDESFRLGGMVEKGSVQRRPGSLQVRFVLTDFKHEVPVTYDRVLPDLFREGQGIIAHGHMTAGVFVADEVLAKHDEKYMPPKIAQAPEGAPGMPGGAGAPAAAAPPAGASVGTGVGAANTSALHGGS